MIKKMTQSEIDSLLKDSDSEDLQSKHSQMQSRVKYQPKRLKQNIEESNQYGAQYGAQSFEDFSQTKKTDEINNKLNKYKQPNFEQKSSVYDSYANQQFDSYDESRRTKQFQRSQPNMKFAKKPDAPQLKPIQQYASNGGSIQQKNNKKPLSQQLSSKLQPNSFNKKKANGVIQPGEKAQRPQSKTKQYPFIKNQQTNEARNAPYNYNRLQERQKQLLFTTLAEQNKKLKQVLAEKEKQVTTVKTKYNILLQQKSQIMGNAKQATLNKRLEQLQAKYDALLKEKAKQRAYKTSTSSMMPKAMANNFVSQTEANQRQHELLNIIQKLKERLISTDKQLKTLNQKMNQGLDYQQQLHRKLKRVQQLQLRLQKMKNQAQDDRFLIENLKQKTQQQKVRIEQLQQQKNELHICLKRAQMTHATHSDLAQQLDQALRQKQQLQKSLRQISLNFTKNIASGAKKPHKQQFDNIQDSNELINYKNKV